MAGASRHGSWALSCSTLRSPNAVEEVCRLGLFRSAMPCQLLSSFGVIFQDSLSALLAAGNCKARCPTREQVQGAGEHVFAKSTETDHVDLFIGHSWKAGRWEKFFSLCTYFNLQFAIACSFTAWFVVVALLVGSMGVTGLGGSMLLFPCLVCFPMVTFAIVLIFGHELPLGRSLPSCWLDRICIHQTDMDKKKEQINALPVFVAQSSKMLVLWDQTYFERLWCNLELATCARYGGTDKVELMPLWLAPWLLSTILLDLSSASILEVMVHLFPNFSAAWMHNIPEMPESIFGHNPAMESFVSSFDVWMFSGIAYLPVSIPSFFCFRAKLLSHQLMLEQMSTFDVRAARCTVASDRASIESQVTALFSGMEDKTAAPLPSAVDDGEVVLQRFEPLQEDPLVRFNAFIRGNLREFVISQIGDELSVPYHICLVAFLPMIFYSSVNVLGCDNGPCASSAKLAGYRSVSEYMITQIVGWVLVFVLAFPLTYPLLLRMINCVLSFGDGPLQLLLAFLCCPLAYIYMYVCGGICWSSFYTLVKEPSAIQLLVFLLVLAVLIMQLLWLFQNPSRRRTESCRCVKRQTYEALAQVQSGE